MIVYLDLVCCEAVSYLSNQVISFFTITHSHSFTLMVVLADEGKGLHPVVPIELEHGAIRLLEPEQR